MKLWQKLALLIIFLVSFGVQIYIAKSDSLTADEPVHLAAGYLHVVKGDYTYNAEHPPLMNDLSGLFIKIFVNPKLPTDAPGSTEQFIYGDKFLFASGNNVVEIIFWGRFPVILFFLATLYLIFIWARSLWGVNGAILSTLLAAVCPNLLVNGHLATTDFILTFAALLNFYLLYKFIKNSSWQNAVYFGLAVGLLLLSKFSGLTVLLLSGVLYFLFFFLNKKKWQWQNFLKLIVSLSIGFFLVWLVYVLSMRADWHWAISYYGLNYYDGLIWFKNAVKWLILPLKKFWDGFSMVTEHNRIGHLSYLNGKFSQMGFWNYFPYVFLYKTPLAIILLLILAIINVFRNFRNEILFIILAPLAYFLFSMTGHINIGLRHILPIYPFIYILIGGLILLKEKWLKIAVLILTGAAILTSVSAFPDYLAFLNKFAFRDDKPQISDSNYDWGQNQIRFANYLNQKGIRRVYFDCYSTLPLQQQGIEVSQLPDKPVKGLIAMCGQQYILKLRGKEGKPDFRWFLLDTPTEKFETIYIWDYR